MSNPTLGVTWAMGAQDDGMDSAIDKALKGLSDINDMMSDQLKLHKDLNKSRAMEGLGANIGDVVKTAKNLVKVMGFAYKQIRRTGGAFKGFMGAAQQRIQQFNVASIASNMRTLTGETGKLTNELEGMGVANAQAVKPIVAQMDISSREMQKMTSQASGMAIALNTDAESIMNIMKATKTAGEPAKKVLDQMGMSTKDWAKVIKTTNVDMQDYVAMTGGLVASWDMAPERVAKMLDSYVEIGKKTGTGIKPLEHMKQQLDDIDRIFKTLPPSMSRNADEIESLMTSTVKLSGAFKQMGATEAESVQYANEASKMFAEQSVAMEKAFKIGGEQSLDEASPLFKFLTQLGVGWKEARSIVNLGSRDAIEGMQKVNDIFVRFGGRDSAQVQHALAGLQETLGGTAAGLTYLAGSADVGRNALDKVSRMAVDGSSSLKKFGKDAYSSGRTLQQTYDLAKESFDTTVRSIARADVRGLVKKQMAGMRDAGKELKKLAGHETWGPMVKMMSQYKQMGIGGIFSSFAERSGVGARQASKMGTMAGAVFDTVSQIGSELAPIMEMMGMMGPLGPLLAAGGIAGLLVLDDSTSKKILGPLFETFDRFRKTVKSMWYEDALPAIKDVWGNHIVPYIKEGWSEGIVPAIKKGWSEEIAPAIKDVWINDVVPAMKDGIVGIGRGMAVEIFGKDLAEKIWGVGGDRNVSITEERKEINKVIASLAKTGDKDLVHALMQDSENLRILVEKLGGGETGAGEWDTFARSISARIEKGLIAPGASAREVMTNPWTGKSEDLGGRDEAIVLNILRELRYAEKDLAKKGLEDAAAGAFIGGKGVSEQFARGMVESSAEWSPAVEGAITDMAAPGMGNSPPLEGPLSGEGTNSRMYMGGYGVMEQFALGIMDSAGMIRNSMEMVLTDAVITTMDEYATKMQQMAEQKSLIEGIAKSMVRDMGGKIETSVDVAGETENVKRRLEAALSIPGLAGVTAAVVSEGAKTRETIGRVVTELEKQTVIMANDGGGKEKSGRTVL